MESGKPVLPPVRNTICYRIAVNSEAQTVEWIASKQSPYDSSVQRLRFEFRVLPTVFSSHPKEEIYMIRDSVDAANVIKISLLENVNGAVRIFVVKSGNQNCKVNLANSLEIALEDAYIIDADSSKKAFSCHVYDARH